VHQGGWTSCEVVMCSNMACTPCSPVLSPVPYILAAFTPCTCRRTRKAMQMQEAAAAQLHPATGMPGQGNGQLLALPAPPGQPSSATNAGAIVSTSSTSSPGTGLLSRSSAPVAGASSAAGGGAGAAGGSAFSGVPWGPSGRTPPAAAATSSSLGSSLAAGGWKPGGAGGGGGGDGNWEGLWK
jgi:hypothetical protein